ncbi:hypothetical protein CQW23_22584 [Capsicum baccatum]|uniref:Uncharacterized protein n=1 Tax=Capsicum baccatum TaxID=33114 RepID=A0A2G2W1B6_CAPBA|nr:hypothetical protein CQW23_22584 [Capsicum baccatum]
MAPPPPALLLGPPEVHGISTTITTPPPTLRSLILTPEPLSPGSTPRSMHSESFNASSTLPPMGLTENGSATFLSSGNPCLNFFFHIVPDTPHQDLLKRLECSWNFDSLITLKLICNLRGVRGTGKSMKDGFYICALWLHIYHSKTLACNVKAIADFRYFKDVLEILYRLVEGHDVRKNEKEEWEEKKDSGFLEKKNSTISYVCKSKAKRLRLEKIADTAKKLLSRYDQDSDFQFLYDNESIPTRGVEYEDVEDAHYAYRVRDRLRKEVLVPLHKALEIPEVYICANKWGELPYKRVPSVAMTLYRKLFYKNDKERFEQYVSDVKEGKTTIAAGALLPHEIIASLNDPTGTAVAEVQWERMVSDLAKKGKLTNCKLITFSADPEFHVVKGKNLSEKTNFIRRMEWGCSTNFQQVFDKILEVAVKGKLSEEQMIKRLFVFNDMEFDQASGTPWETDYQVIQKKLKKKGYNKVPEIVFWDLRNSEATPVPSNQQGVALVSGFSKNLVTIFLEEGGVLSPESVMMQAISGEEYEKLVVYD